MADYQAIKYTGANYGANYEIKNAVFMIKTAKNYSDLEKALTINFFSQLDVYDDSFAEQFKHFKRGYLQRALGAGLRFVETFGLLQARQFKPAQPGSKVCLEIPNNTPERAETIGKLTRIYCSSKEPDILDAYDLFVDPSELFEFTKNKIGNIRQSIALFLDITFSYILSLDPWGDDKADHFNSFTIGNMLAAKWDDTAIVQFGDDKTGIGNILKSIKEDLKVEIDKETKLKNVNVFNVWDWLPTMIKPNFSQQMKQGTKPKKPTAALDSAKLKKMYLSNIESDPNLCAAAISRCLSYHIEMMIGESTAQNDSMFPGNLEDKGHEYGKTARNNKAELENNTPSMFLPIRLPEEELVIIMNSDLYKELKTAALVSGNTEAGAYNPYIQNFMKWDSHIVKLDTMPYGAFKIGSKNRYNIWDIYDKVETDKLGQADVVVHTAHRAIAFGIRQFRPFKYIRLNGIYTNPTTRENNVEFKTATDIQ